MTQHEYFLPGQFSITTINAVYYKTDYDFQHQKASQKSYYIGDWTVHMLQLHRLPLLAVTGQKPHNEEKAKSPICQDWNSWGTSKRKEKEKREVWLPTNTAAPRLQTKYQALAVLAASQALLHKSNKYTYFSSQSRQHIRPVDCSDHSNCHEITLQFLM